MMSSLLRDEDDEAMAAATEDEIGDWDCFR
jgi:hypothetical protein